MPRTIPLKQEAATAFKRFQREDPFIVRGSEKRPDRYALIDALDEESFAWEFPGSAGLGTTFSAM